ncbi:MAG: lamin tail domain-containing protein [Flavobacteriales bacterium]|nr:MAG: lamin tail domain-containing protein [Flavobacteriales bacterium]
MARPFPTFLAALGCLFLSASVCAQFADDFSDNDFTNGVVWAGSTTLFTAATGQLQSQSPGAANYYLSTASSSSTNAQWEWFANLKFSTSGANYADMYLMSSAADLASGVNGYFVRMGGTQDRLELFRSDAGTNISLLASADGIVNSSTDNPFKIRVTRDAANNWTLLYDDGALGSFTSAGTVLDATYNTSTHFGVRIEQSTAASAVNNHFFDDFSVGAIPVDLAPPSVMSVTAISATQVDVQYDEALDAGAIGTYDIIPFIGVSAQLQDGIDPALVHVTPSIALTSGNTYSLLSSGAEDAAGNAAGAASTDFTFIIPAVAGPRDVVINEIMADPSPTVGLPDAEFVEIHNPTTDAFDLAGWIITDGSTNGVLPAFNLLPGAYAILTDDANAALFPGFGDVLSIASFPSLNNDGDPLELKDDGGVVIDAVAYDIAWYNDDAKDDGGWTLEQKNPGTPCSGGTNWSASTAGAGGTPGTANSILNTTPDVQPPSLVSVQVNSTTSITLVFNEEMNAASLVAGTYSIAPAITVVSVTAGAPPVTSATLVLGQPLVVGQQYTISVTSVSDCPGNTIGSSNTATFALPEPASPGDIVINEVLYDPRVGGYDFVELYNASSKTLSLADLKLANEENGTISNITAITTQAVLLLPGKYIAITENTANITAEYPLGHTDRYFQTDIPSYNNGDGTVVLMDVDGDTLDLFRYNDDLHFELLNSTEGVSLERIDPARPSSDNTNWHSAAEAVGSATPGYRNSQYSATDAPTGELVIDRAIFSPDNDGFEDVLTMAYRFDQAGFMGNIIIYDQSGREAKKLMQNELLGTTGSISWDGILDTNEKARMGPYIVVFEVFDLAGNVETYRKTVVLAHKL